MKKVLFGIVILLIVWSAVYFYFGQLPKKLLTPPSVAGTLTEAKRPILRIGLVADSENDNVNLKKALDQLQGIGVNFVIGLGDWSSVGIEGELSAAKKVFDDSRLTYFLTAGDHDLWDSRNRGEALANFNKVFGDSSRVMDREGIRIVLLDNSDIYTGISQEGWEILNSKLPFDFTQGKQAPNSKLTFVFAHKTPFHPESAHVMGENSDEVSGQARKLMNLLQEGRVDGFFSGDMHFFAKFKSPDASVRITTIGAIEADRNFQGPRFGVLTIWNDYSWDVEDIEIR